MRQSLRAPIFLHSAKRFDWLKHPLGGPQGVEKLEKAKVC